MKNFAKNFFHKIAKRPTASIKKDLKKKNVNHIPRLDNSLQILPVKPQTKNHLIIFYLIKKFVTILKTKAAMRKISSLHSLHYSIIADKIAFDNPFKYKKHINIYVFFLIFTFSKKE